MLNALLTGNGSYTLKRFTLFVPTLPPITFLEQTFNSSNMSLGTLKLFAFNSSLGIYVLLWTYDKRNHTIGLYVYKVMKLISIITRYVHTSMFTI